MHTDGWDMSVVCSLSVVDDPVLIVLYENKLELKSTLAICSLEGQQKYCSSYILKL